MRTGFNTSSGIPGLRSGNARPRPTPACSCRGPNRFGRRRIASTGLDGRGLNWPPQLKRKAWATLGDCELLSRRWHASSLFLLAACRAGAGSNTPGSAAHDSSGVTIVQNSGDDVPLGWRLERVATIGGGGSSIELSQLTEYTVDADTLGHIYVIDSWFGQKVQLIDTAGALIRTLTRKGAGPGEIGEGVSISVSGDGTLAVMDFTKMGLVRLLPDGSVLPLLPLTGYDLFGGGRAAGDTVIFHTLDPRSKAYAEQLRYRTDTDTATLATHVPERLGWLPFCRDGMEGLTPMLAPELRWTARGSRAILTRSSDYRIDAFQASRFTQSIRREVPRVVGNVEAVKRFFPQGKIIGSRECVVPPDELVRKRGVAPVLQPIRRLALDWEGSIWAERNTFPDEVSRVDVFDKSGHYMGTLAGFGAPLGFPSRDLLLFALPDSASDEPKLAIFRRVK
jgi:hypothetical protein